MQEFISISVIWKMDTSSISSQEVKNAKRRFGQYLEGVAKELEEKVEKLREEEEIKLNIVESRMQMSNRVQTSMESLERKCGRLCGLGKVLVDLETTVKAIAALDTENCTLEKVNSIPLYL